MSQNDQKQQQNKGNPRHARSWDHTSISGRQNSRAKERKSSSGQEEQNKPISAERPEMKSGSKINGSFSAAEWSGKSQPPKSEKKGKKKSWRERIQKEKRKKKKIEEPTTVPNVLHSNRKPQFHFLKNKKKVITVGKVSTVLNQNRLKIQTEKKTTKLAIRRQQNKIKQIQRNRGSLKTHRL